MKSFNVLIVMLIMVVMAFAVNVFAAPSLELLTLTGSTPWQSEVKSLGNIETYQNPDLSLDGRIVFAQASIFAIGGTGHVGSNLEKIAEKDNLSYGAGFFGRTSVNLFGSEVGIEPLAEWRYDDSSHRGIRNIRSNQEGYYIGAIRDAKG